MCVAPLEFSAFFPLLGDETIPAQVPEKQSARKEVRPDRPAGLDSSSTGQL